MINEVAILCYLKHSIFNQNLEDMQRSKKWCPLSRNTYINDTVRRNCLGGGPDVDFLNKVFKAVILNMFRRKKKRK